MTRLDWVGTCRPVSVLLLFEGPGAPPLFHIAHGSNPFAAFVLTSLVDLLRARSWRGRRLAFSRVEW